jgi:hypothetical protein
MNNDNQDHLMKVYIFHLPIKMNLSNAAVGTHNTSNSHRPIVKTAVVGLLQQLSIPTTTL